MHYHFATVSKHYEVIKWKCFPRYWPFVQGIHRPPVNSPHRGQWRGTLMNCARTNGWETIVRRWFETPSRPFWRHGVESSRPYVMFVIPHSCMHRRKIIICKIATGSNLYENHTIKSPANRSDIQSSSEVPYISTDYWKSVHASNIRSKKYSPYKINKDYFQYRLRVIIIKARNISKPPEWAWHREWG